MSQGKSKNIENFEKSNLEMLENPKTSKMCPLNLSDRLFSHRNGYFLITKMAEKY